MDVGVGAFFSNVVMFFTILTTAITLKRHGTIHIATSRQAAEAFWPLAGSSRPTLFNFGAVSVSLDFAGINPVKALYWAVVISGRLPPFFLFGILLVAADKKLIPGQPRSRRGWGLVAVTTGAISLPA